MASVIFHAFNQIKKEGVVKLFKSHRQGFEDGKQLRDFVYVKDVVKVIVWMMEKYKLTIDNPQLVENKLTVDSSKLTEKNSNKSSFDSPQFSNTSHPSSIICHLSSGIYNLGTGTARTFEDLVKATFAGLDMKPNIVYI
ncbi:MAG: NAD-dependent epimerase/dehydratase family protein [Segetibacter sp.]